MAATYADLSRLDAILRDRPLMDGIQKAINTATPFAEKITQELTLSGRKGIFPVQFGVNEGIYARADRGSFGDSQVNQPLLAEIAAKFIYAIFEISGPTISATRDEFAFEEALALSLENTITGVKLDMARMILNASSNGVMALVQAKTSTTVLEIDSPLGLLSYKGNVPVKNLIRKNQALDVIDVTSPPDTLHHTNHTVSSIAHGATASTLTLGTAEATAPADGDFITRSGNWGNEILGFFAGVFSAALGGSDTYLNVSRTGNTGWNGVLVDGADGGATAVDLDPDMLRNTVDQIMEDSGETPNLIVGSYKQRRNIYNLYAPQIRYTPMVLPAGLREQTLAFDDIPVLAERMFPAQHIGFVNTAFWYHAVDKDTEWIPGMNGTVLHVGAFTSDVMRAVLRTYRNFCTLYPAANGVLYGVSEG